VIVSCRSIDVGPGRTDVFSKGCAWVGLKTAMDILDILKVKQKGYYNNFSTGMGDLPG
jgi:hypothetical protein